MSGPCLCGDTDCPSCGTLQGTYGGDDSDVLEDGHDCPNCGEVCACEPGNEDVGACEHECDDDPDVDDDTETEPDGDE